MEVPTPLDTNSQLAFGFQVTVGLDTNGIELGGDDVGITPRQYLRWHRMHSTHSQLLASDAETTTITDVAAHWGFTELGRFAVEHKQLFGESPSVTLSRRKARPAKRLSDALPG